MVNSGAEYCAMHIRIYSAIINFAYNINTSIRNCFATLCYNHELMILKHIR